MTTGCTFDSLGMPIQSGAVLNGPLGSSLWENSKSMMLLWPRSSLRRAIVLLMSMYGLLSTGVLAGLLVQLRADDIAAGESLVSAFAQLTATNTEEVVRDVEEALRLVEAKFDTSTVASSTPPEPISAWLRQVRDDRPGVRELYVLDKRGYVTHHTNLLRQGLDQSEEQHFISHKENPGMGFDFGLPIASRTGESVWVIPATLPLRHPGGAFAGVLVAEIEAQFFNRAWTFDRDIAGMDITLTNAEGQTLMRAPFVEGAMGGPSTNSRFSLRLAPAQVSGVLGIRSTLDGRDHLVAFRRIASHPDLVIIVSQPTSEVLAAWWHVVWIVSSGWVIATIVLSGLVIWLTRVWKAQRATQDRYRLLFDSVPHPMAVVSLDGRRFLTVNDATVEHYGWAREELLAMSSSDALYPPEDLSALREMIEQCTRTSGRPVQGLRHCKKDGTIIDVEMDVRLTEFKGQRALLMLVRDISAQLRAERARLAAEDQLRQSQKMEAVGQLTGGIAHDFNNILTVILANADALQEDDELDVKLLPERVGQISDAVLRASELTRQLLAFSRKQALSPKPTDLNNLVSGTGKLLHRALGEHIQIDLAFADDLWTVNVDRAQLETALVNLCVNARDAMPNGGKLLIETRNVSFDENNVSDIVAGDYAMLAVTDNGSGMPPETLAKVFDPFFTTKEVGKGTGLGLSMVYGFIKQSNGQVRAYSEAGIGTTFKLYLPRSDGVTVEVSGQPTAPMPRGAERVLVVEDEPQVRASVIGQLKSLGYAVSSAADGSAAIAAFEAAARPFDLLLTDMVMPGPLNGKALASEVARRWPVTKAVFMSGYTPAAIMQHGQLATSVLLLSKPFRKNELAQIVRRALNGTN